MLTLAILRQRWPNATQRTPGLLEGIATAAPRVFATYGVTTPLLVAHAMAQFSAECGEGCEMIEDLDYTAARLLKVFGSKYFTPELAAECAHLPEKIGPIVYGGRNGNAPAPSDDGYVFRGAGLSQVTGRAGVTALQATLAEHGAAFNVLTHPELIIAPATTLECGIADWIACRCLAPAANDDLRTETRRLNGGLNGMPERTRQLGLWKAALGVPAMPPPAKQAASKTAQRTVA